MNPLRPDIAHPPLSRRIEESADELLLPSHGALTSALLDALESSTPDLDRVARIILTDPSLCARFLLFTVETSPSSPLILDIPATIRKTPLRLLRAIATSLAIHSFHTRHLEERHHDLGGFLAHSLSVAHLCRLIARETGEQDPMEAYCAGLLHDIGELVILAGAGAGYGLLLGVCADEQELLSLEPQYTGTTHAEAGSSFLSRIGSRSFIPDAILFHHLPVDEIRHADLLSRILWTAHSLLTTSGGDSSPHGEHTLLTGVPPETLTPHVKSIPRLVADDFRQLEIPSPSRKSQLPLVNHIPTESYSSDERTPPNVAGALETSLTGMALMAPLQQSLFDWEEEAELISAISLAARLLFGTRMTLLLLHDRQRSCLMPISPPPEAIILQRLTLPAEGPSTPARAFTGGAPASTFDVTSPATSTDRQIARLLGSDGFIAIPFDGGEESRGVLLFSLSVRQQARHAKQIPLMRSFTTVTASALAGIFRLKRREEEIVSRLRDEFIRHSRRVIHEVSNPLGIINQYLAILGETVGERALVTDQLGILKEEIDRIGKIVATLGELPPPGAHRNLTPLNSVIEGMMALYGESLFSSRGIRVRKELYPDIPSIRGEKDRFKQILLNLWKNASEAMPEGGEILISTGMVSGDQGSRFVELVIADSGPGIPPDVATKIFSPLEPESRRSGGGVGLSIVASLIRELGGTIYCHTTPENGTRFTIIFPAD
ncbi:MAG: hypothetical protein Fur0034_09110 [Desulfuromonadia bacterium]